MIFEILTVLGLVFGVWMAILVVIGLAQNGLKWNKEA